MLVLTRKLKEQIRIGDNITITILRIKGKSVRIGIDAPDHVRILRSELPGHLNASSDSRSRSSALADETDLPAVARNDSSRRTTEFDEGHVNEAMQHAASSATSTTEQLDANRHATLQLLLARRQRRRPGLPILV